MNWRLPYLEDASSIPIDSMFIYLEASLIDGIFARKQGWLSNHTKWTKNGVPGYPKTKINSWICD